jgi:hypothetical protein
MGLWRWYVNVTVITRDINHRPVFYLKLNVSENAFCLRISWNLLSRTWCSLCLRRQRQRLSVSVGCSWVGSAWRPMHNAVSETWYKPHSCASYRDGVWRHRGAAVWAPSGVEVRLVNHLETCSKLQQWTSRVVRCQQLASSTREKAASWSPRVLHTSPGAILGACGHTETRELVPELSADGDTCSLTVWSHSLLLSWSPSQI